MERRDKMANRLCLSFWFSFWVGLVLCNQPSSLFLSHLSCNLCVCVCRKNVPPSICCVVDIDQNGCWNDKTHLTRCGMHSRLYTVFLHCLTCQTTEDPVQPGLSQNFAADNACFHHAFTTLPLAFGQPLPCNTCIRVVLVCVGGRAGGGGGRGGGCA